MKQERMMSALMAASLSGDVAAHRTLFQALSGHLRAYYKGRLVRAGRKAFEIEDLVQECLLAVHTRRHTYDPDQPFTPWVYAIARYKLIDHLRLTKTSITNISIGDAGELIGQHDPSETESAVDMTKLLACLPEKVSLSIRYVKIDGLSVAEAARQCGISKSAVKINIHRGPKTLLSLIGRKNKGASDKIG